MNRIYKKQAIFLILSGAFSVFLAACGTTKNIAAETTEAKPSTALYRSLAAALEEQLKNELSCFYPRCVDNVNGGFTASFSNDWQKLSRQSKQLVFQSRLTWVAAQISMRRNDMKQEYLNYAKHGADYLRNVMWDKVNGGFYWELTEKGSPDAVYRDEKHAYGTAFAIYALSAVYQAGGNKEDIDFAINAFRWLDSNGHDPVNGGYYESFTREGKVVMNAQDLPDNMLAADGKLNKFDRIGTLYGYKSMNTQIHILEAFTELYKVWPDQLLKTRLEEMLSILKDRIITDPGAMNLFFTPDWRAIPDSDSFGHDVETAFLIIEASEALGKHQDKSTHTKAQSLVDHALEYGFDQEHGGIYESGSAFRPAFDKSKAWWAQSEWINALVLMHRIHGKNNQAYFNAFVRSWRFIVTYQIDHNKGGWYCKVEENGTLPDAVSKKTDNWKAAYHTCRALLTASETLTELSREK